MHYGHQKSQNVQNLKAMNKKVRNIVVFGVALVLLAGMGFNYFYAYKIKQDDDLVWFVAMLMYSLVMLIQQSYIFYHEVFHYESDAKAHACWGTLTFFILSVMSVLIGFTMFTYGVIWIAMFLIVFPLLLYALKRLVIR